MLEIRNIVLELEEPLGYLKQKLTKLLQTEDFTYEIKKESLDARRRRGEHHIRFLYQVYVHLDNPQLEKKALRLDNVYSIQPVEAAVQPGTKPLAQGLRPIVVGFGPAGIFAAYLLAKHGYKPLIVERGEAVEERQVRIETFWTGGPLNPESNVQFGEGGAGTFSDGKLTSRSKDPWATLVKQVFIDHGAPEDIQYSHESHIGTDLLRDIIVSIRKQIMAWGGEVYFSTKMERLLMDSSGQVTGIRSSRGDFHGPVFLGIGHSARDSFRTLYQQGIYAEAKAFAVGFRIEHPQDLINTLRFGQYKNHPRLGAASYAVRSSMDKDKKNCYSFCMCPGGFVIQASSEPGRLVTNGMSYHARDGFYANSALLTSVRPGEDFGSGVLDGITYQESIEQKAYILGGSNAYVPVMAVEDFLRVHAGKEISLRNKLQTSMRPGISVQDLTSIYSEAVTQRIALGLEEIDRNMPGFAGSEANLLGVETRSSSPVRWTRDNARREAIDHPGLYPIGEGAGYAGGIISAALDGLRSAERFISEYKPL